jgi:hypothetical protein
MRAGSIPADRSRPLLIYSRELLVNSPMDRSAGRHDGMRVIGVHALAIPPLLFTHPSSLHRPPRPYDDSLFI